MMPTEHDRICGLFMAESRAHIAHDNTSNGYGEESYDMTPIHHSVKVRCRHIACDNRLDCISTNNMLANMTTKSNQSLLKGEKRMRLG